MNKKKLRNVFKAKGFKFRILRVVHTGRTKFRNRGLALLAARPKQEMSSHTIRMSSHAIRDWRQDIKNARPILTTYIEITYRGMIEHVQLGSDKESALDSVFHTVTFLRSMSRRCQLTHKTRGEVSYQVCGGVFSRPQRGAVSWFKELCLDFARRTYTTSSKRPKSLHTQYLGVEVEFYSPLTQDEIVEVLKDSKLKGKIVIKHDGSLESNDDFGHEFALLTTRRKFRQDVKEMCRVLKHVEATVDSTCGLHVHLDMRSKDVQTVYKKLVACQDILANLQPASRRGNMYCRSVNSLAWDTECRYRVVNAVAYEDHQTLEVRVHTGTTNPRKICNWINLLTRIADMPFVPDIWVQNPTQLESFVKLPKFLKRYIDARFECFQERLEEAA